MYIQDEFIWRVLSDISDVMKEARKKLGQMELYLLCYSITHKDIITTLL